MATGRKTSRYGHRDATTILLAYRHGLRASEVCVCNGIRSSAPPGGYMCGEPSAARRAFIQSRAMSSALYAACSVSNRRGHMCSVLSEAGQ